MPAGVNVPVLVGVIPLFYVQSMSISEGYQVQRIAGSRFVQMTAPTTKRIQIEALLIGRGRLLLKKLLEAEALTSRALVASVAPAIKITGIPVASGLTISLDMQITSLSFTQTTDKRDALACSITLEHVPRSNLTAIIGEAADLALAAGSVAIPTEPKPNAIPRTPDRQLSGSPTPGVTKFVRTRPQP